MKETNPLAFKAAEIREKGHFTLDLKPDLALFADAFEAPDTLKSLRLTLTFTPLEGEILLQGRVEAELKFNCARCDAPVTRKYSDSFDELYPDAVECIDAHEPARETAGLLAPLRVLCSEDCKGRCPQCGGDLNRKACGCRIEKASPFSALKDFKPASEGRQEPPNGKKPGGKK